MKMCMVCIRQAPNEQATCVSCGEASWGMPRPDIGDRETTPGEDATESPRTKRGSRKT